MATLTVRRFLQQPLSLVALVVLCTITASSFAGPVITPTNLLETEAARRLEPPSAEHFFGTDDLGRDLLFRTLYAGQVSLLVGVCATLVSTSVGTTIGVVAGYWGGEIDNFLMRLTDLFLCFPQIFVILLINALLRETQLSYVRSNPITVALLIGAMGWMELARLIRGVVLSLKEHDFILASRALGATPLQITARHLLPNVASIIIVNATLMMGSAILSEAGLSYLGFGIQPPTPSWGNILNRAQVHFYFAPWFGLFPGLFIFITVLSVNYVGEGLRAALDPNWQAEIR